MSTQEKSQKVDLVHLASNIDSYGDWGGNEWQAFRAMVLDDQATFGETQMAVYHCLKTGLNPLDGQIHFIRRKGKLTPQIGITGFHKLAHDTNCYRGMTPVYWCGKDGEWKDVWLDADNPPFAAKVGAYHKDFVEPFWAVAIYHEYKPKGNEGFMWDKMSAHMIAKCVKALALRETFPSLSGYYTPEEMAQAGPPDSVRVRVEDPPQPEKRVSTSKAKTQPKSKAKPSKTKRVRYLMNVASKKFGLTGDALNQALQAFADERELLTVDPAKGGGSIASSSAEQIENLIKELNLWNPEQADIEEDGVQESEPEDKDDDVQDATYTAKGGAALVDEIEALEAHLSQIPDPDARGQWQARALSRALQHAPKYWPGVKVNIFGPLDENGEPIAHRWTDDQLFRWLRYLQLATSQEAKF